MMINLAAGRTAESVHKPVFPRVLLSSVWGLGSAFCLPFLTDLLCALLSSPQSQPCLCPCCSFLVLRHLLSALVCIFSALALLSSYTYWILLSSIHPPPTSPWRDSCPCRFPCLPTRTTTTWYICFKILRSPFAFVPLLAPPYNPITWVGQESLSLFSR